MSVTCPSCGHEFPLIPQSRGEIEDRAREDARIAASAVYEAERRAMMELRRQRLVAIADAVARFYYLTLDVMIATSRTSRQAWPRQVAVYLMAMADPDVTQSEIAEVIRRDRSTVSTSIRVVRDRMGSDDEFADGVRQCAAALGIAA